MKWTPCIHTNKIKFLLTKAILKTSNMNSIDLALLPVIITQTAASMIIMNTMILSGNKNTDGLSTCLEMNMSYYEKLLKEK